VNLDECGVCTSLAIYCLVHGLDYRTIPRDKLSNQARLFVFDTVMGYNFDQDGSYDSTLDELKGTITIGDDTSPGVPQNDGCNRAGSGQHILRATNPPDIEQVQLNQLYFPNAVGVVESTGDEYTADDEDEDFEEEYQQQALEAETLQHSHYLIDVAINMADQAEQENLISEGNGGERETQEKDPSSAQNETEKLMEEQEKLENECMNIKEQLKKMHEEDE
jgi:hypothetical protein